mgnify:CR=1 FL=1
MALAKDDAKASVTLQMVLEQVQASFDCRELPSMSELKKAMEGGNTADIKAKTDELQKAVYDLSSKVYQAAGAAQQAAQGGDAQSNNNNNGGANGGSDDNGFVDAQFTEE